ncbi:MAG: BCD family MFS transporter [Hyphomicrobium sp.]|nr:BCD family MFS transporter [Hyphomicrobium sp.]
MTTRAATTQHLSWIEIVRLGLVQTALGAIVVLTTSTINRVMVVEYALPAVVPGLLVGWHYALQILRPRWGFGSDVGGRRTPWILFGMAVLAVGGFTAAIATALIGVSLLLAIIVAIFAFTLVGIGVGAAGTSLLALLAVSVSPVRRPAAATIVWMMMIVGFIVTTITASAFLDPFSGLRLVAVSGTVSLIAMVLSAVALWGIERPRSAVAAAGAEGAAASVEMDSPSHAEKPAFGDALRDVWRDAAARRFTIFVFISMLAYSMQDLILEPFAGIVFAMTPGQSTRLAGLQHSGVFAGMLLVAIAARPSVGLGSLRVWTIGGCIASALALMLIVMAGLSGPPWPIEFSVMALGVANGAFAVAAIGSMMGLAGKGQSGREGVRMGLWGASQAIAFGLGGLVGAAAADLARLWIGDAALAYVTVFGAEAALFLIAAWLARDAIDLPAPAPVSMASMRTAATPAITDRTPVNSLLAKTS